MFRQPLGALIFFIAATAEANRTPFDLTEADSEIVAGFATEYSGMRFGFLFFAEYVNVFIISALLVTLFFGAWNAPFPFPHVEVALDPGSLGVGLLLLLVGGAPVARDPGCSPRRSTSSAARPRHGRRWCSGSCCSTSWPSACCSDSPTSVVDWVAGLVWFMAKSFAFVYVFVWMRGTFPRVRIDQLMGFAWKWLLPAALLNLFVTAAAIVVVQSLKAG